MRRISFIVGGNMKDARSLWIQTALAFAFVLFFSLMAVGQQSTAVPALVKQPIDLQKLVTLQGNVHPLARPEYDQGLAPDSLLTERILLVLRRSTQQEAALRKLLDQQQFKASPNYHMWLAPEEFGEQFGPAGADIQAVTDWLTSQGFQVSHVAAGRTIIEFSGTAGLVRQALHTEIHKYVVHGEEHWANASDPQIPAALAPVVAGFASLNNFPKKPMGRVLGTFSKSKATGVVKPLFTYPQGNGYLLAVGPGDFATIYNLNPLYSASTAIDGTGQTIAVVGQTNINIQDVEDFRTMFGLPANDPKIILNGPDPGILSSTGDEGEADLDVQWSGAVARGATIDFVVSQTTEVTQGVDLSALYIIDNNLAPVMTESYGLCEAGLTASGNSFYSTVWEQGAAEGITIVEAAGDNGSAACDFFGPSQETAAELGLAVNGNASTAFNVAVGGTDFNEGSGTNWQTYWNTTNSSPSQTSAKSYIPEMTWNDSCADAGVNGCTSVSSDGTDLVGGGGGESNCISSVGTFPNSYTCNGGYGKPPWQTGTGVPADTVRDVPDVSMFAGDGANSSFYVFCEMDANAAAGGSSTSCDLNSPYTDFIGAGGTSASAQVFGAIMALVNQKYGRQGNANYVLYPLAATSGASCPSNAATVSSTGCVFYDIQTGNNSVACVADSSNCSNQSLTGLGYGILVNPNNSLQAAWVTTPGFDLATGLGTVNAANLVSKWPSANFTPSTTTLTLTAPTGYTLSNIPHGQPVGFTVTVSPAASTGDVSLLGGPTGYNASCTSTPCNLGITFATLSNGTASGSTVSLPGGTYGVTASYAGDGIHAASESSPAKQVTVTPENSETFVSLATYDPSTGQITSTNATSAVYGSTYLMHIDVTNSTGNLCYSVSGGNAYECPTGYVVVTLNGNKMPTSADVGAPSDNAPGTYNLNSQGHAEDQFIQLPVGTNTLVASYVPYPIGPGPCLGQSYCTSTSTADSITISQATSTTTVTGPGSTPPNTPVTLTATVSTGSFGLAPTGTVTFSNGTNLISGTPTYTPVNGNILVGTLASLTATVSTSFSAAASITAKYSGDVNYGNSTSAALSIGISSTPDFQLTASPTTFSLTPGQSGLTVISASSLGGFSGTVNATCVIPSGMTGATCTLSSSSFSVSSTSSGSVNMVVATTAPSTAWRVFNRPVWFMPSAGALLACTLLLLTWGKKRRVKLAFGLLAFALLAASFVACGGGSSTTPPPNLGTPAGNWTITVTGTNGNLSHTLNVPVTVD
jgi:subtilase family serine protease